MNTNRNRLISMSKLKNLMFSMLLAVVFFCPQIMPAFDLTEADLTDESGDGMVLKGWNISSGEKLTYVLINNNTPSSEISADDWTNAVENSFQAWEDVDNCYVAFTYETGANVTDGKVTLNYPDIPSTYYSQRAPDSGDGPPADAGKMNVISCIEDWTAFKYSSAALAITAVLYYPTTRYIVSADMFLNCGGSFGWTTSGDASKYDVQNVVTHEAGHFIGIGHPYKPTRFESTMWSTAPTGETDKRTLEDDDKYAAIYIYPANMTLVTTPAVHSPDYNLWGLRDTVTGEWTNTGPSGTTISYTESSGGGGGCNLSSRKTDKIAFFTPYVILLFAFFIFRRFYLLNESKLRLQKIRIKVNATNVPLFADKRDNAIHKRFP
jgi:hypothetical protein